MPIALGELWNILSTEWNPTVMMSVDNLRVLPRLILKHGIEMYRPINKTMHSYRQAVTSWIRCRDEELSWVKMFTCSLKLHDSSITKTDKDRHLFNLQILYQALG